VHHPTRSSDWRADRFTTTTGKRTSPWSSGWQRGKVVHLIRSGTSAPPGGAVFTPTDFYED